MQIQNLMDNNKMAHPTFLCLSYKKSMARWSYLIVWLFDSLN